MKFVLDLTPSRSRPPRFRFFQFLPCCFVATGLIAQQSTNVSSSPTEVFASVDASLLLDAAGAAQRISLRNVYLIGCKKGNQISFGTGFLITAGVIITNAHVVDGCSSFPLQGISTQNVLVTFKNFIEDQKRDLAILIPSKQIDGGYELATKDDPEPGTRVDTWGYPFGLNGASPLLSVGYIAGYRNVVNEGKTVKHIVVNGAINHGNSGGPLLVSQDNKVIGIVELTFHFYPPRVKQIIDAMASNTSGLGFTETLPDGTSKTYAESQLTSMVLDEFYDKTQIDIGEAIAVSELRAFIVEHTAELPPMPSKLTPKRSK